MYVWTVNVVRVETPRETPRGGFTWENVKPPTCQIFIFTMAGGGFHHLNRETPHLC